MLLTVGVVGLFIPNFPAGDVIRWAVVVSVIAFVADFFSERKVL